MRNSRDLVLESTIKKPEDLATYKGLDPVLGVYVGRILIEPQPKAPVVVPVSGLSGIQVAGSKCSHGVYIPSTSPYPDHAEYCSECCPYMLLVKKGGTFKA